MRAPESWSGVSGPRRAELRRRWAAGLPLPCHRCGLPVMPGDRFDLEHDPPWSLGGRTVVGVSHASCNRSHGARLGNAQRNPRPTPGRRPEW